MGRAAATSLPENGHDGAHRDVPAFGCFLGILTDYKKIGVVEKRDFWRSALDFEGWCANKLVEGRELMDQGAQQRIPASDLTAGKFVREFRPVGGWTRRKNQAI